VVLSREKLNDLHDHGRLVESVCNNAYSCYLLGKPQTSEDLVRSVEDLLENTRTIVQELLAPPP